jgi:hypothetical protein
MPFGCQYKIHCKIKCNYYTEKRVNISVKKEIISVKKGVNIERIIIIVSLISDYEG